jgi:hypothetical protein
MVKEMEICVVLGSSNPNVPHNSPNLERKKKVSRFPDFYHKFQ